MRPMWNLYRSTKESYSEVEAAAAVGISVARLRELLDRYVFTGLNPRPASIEFTSSDLLLLGYWNHRTERGPGKVIAMPKRR